MIALKLQFSLCQQILLICPGSWEVFINRINGKILCARFYLKWLKVPYLLLSTVHSVTRVVKDPQALSNYCKGLLINILWVLLWALVGPESETESVLVFLVSFNCTLENSKQSENLFAAGSSISALGFCSSTH